MEEGRGLVARPSFIDSEYVIVIILSGGFIVAIIVFVLVDIWWGSSAVGCVHCIREC